MKRYIHLIAALLFAASTQANALTVEFPFDDVGFGDGRIDKLEELDTWLQQNYTSGDVTVYIAPGTYKDAVKWSFDAGENQLTITGADTSNLPVFDGCANGSCISGQSNGYFFRLEPSSSQAAYLNNVTLQYLSVKNYTNGISVARTNNAVLRGIKLQKIGSAFNDEIPLKANGDRAYNGFSAITLRETYGAQVGYNLVNQAYNDDRPLWMHAVYLVKSENSLIARNRINLVSGDPIRIRNESVGVLVDRNEIQSSGQVAVSTFERVGTECPSWNISSSYNRFGMTFPFEEVYSQIGFERSWANKPYLNEGVTHGQGYKVTADPQLSDESCQYRNVQGKYDVFSSTKNSYVMPVADSRILEQSTGVDLIVRSNPYVRVRSGGQLVLETNQHFVACNSSTLDTCDDMGTATPDDDTDSFNEDDANREYYLAMEVKTGYMDKRLRLSGAGYDQFEFEIPAANNNSWFEYVFPQRVSFANRNEAILALKAVNAGIYVRQVRLVEAY